MAEEFGYCIPHLSDALQSGSSDPWNCGGRAALQVKCDTDWNYAFVLFGGLLRTNFGDDVERSVLHSLEAAPAKGAAWCLKLLSPGHNFWIGGLQWFCLLCFFLHHEQACKLTPSPNKAVLGQTAKFVVGDPPYANFAMLGLLIPTVCQSADGPKIKLVFSRQTSCCILLPGIFWGIGKQQHQPYLIINHTASYSAIIDLSRPRKWAPAETRCRRS